MTGSIYSALVGAGTLSAPQPTFAALTVTGAINTGGQATATTIIANTAAASTITDGTTVMVSIDTRTGVSGGGGVTFLGQPISIATAASVFVFPTINVAAKTVTLTGTGGTATSMFGVSVFLATPIITNASLSTLTAASVLHVATLAPAGGSLVISSAYMISTGVSDCFLTNAGAWTSHSSTAKGKQLIRDALTLDVGAILDRIRPRAWKYKPEVFGNDHNRQRVGIITEELPEALDIPGDYPKGGLADGVVGSFSLAAIKMLWDELKVLREEVARLKSA